MSKLWLVAFSLMDAEIGEMVARHGTERPTDYQLKWDVLRSVASRAIAGKLRHLPSGDSKPVFIKLPV